MVDISTFNENYYKLILQLAKALGTINANAISINLIKLGSVIVEGSASPSGESGTQESTEEFYNFESALS